MKLTPLDVRKQEFKKVMRGYDPVEVDTFMEMVAADLEEALKQQKEARDRIVELETQLKDYRQIEKTLQQTLLQAQEATGRTYESARRESETIIREAESRAAKIVEQANSDLAKINNELMRLEARKESLIGRLRVLLSSELDLLKTLDMGGPDDLSGSSLGTGKESVEIDSILKSINNDRSSQSH
ncbi:MAG: DivIVA domain-containing protein [Bacteroidota bacterium]